MITDEGKRITSVIRTNWHIQKIAVNKKKVGKKIRVPAIGLHFKDSYPYSLSLETSKSCTYDRYKNLISLPGIVSVSDTETLFA